VGVGGRGRKEQKGSAPSTECGTDRKCNPGKFRKGNEGPQLKKKKTPQTGGEKWKRDEK